MKHAEYLGDGAYVQMDDDKYHVALSTDCHISAEGRRPGNVVFLDPRVVRSLLDWLDFHGILEAHGYRKKP